MRIEYINFPWVYTDDGQRIALALVTGNIVVGAEIVDDESGFYKVIASASDSECVNGVCPIK